jgi:hypothetical protein
MRKFALYTVIFSLVILVFILAPLDSIHLKDGLDVAEYILWSIAVLAAAYLTSEGIWIQGEKDKDEPPES